MLSAGDRIKIYVLVFALFAVSAMAQSNLEHATWEFHSMARPVR